MNMKKIMMICAMMSLALGASAQGNNTGMGGEDGNYESLASRLFKLEKKSDAFNVYFNYASSFQEAYDGNDWGSSFKNKQARLEIKGSFGKLSYRFRHRLNKANGAQGEDNFAKATDILSVGYQVTDKLGITGGKMCQNWGGFEFDENPMYIYQYSDMVDNMDNFMAGVNFAFKPVESQEFNLNITNAYNNKLAQEYGADLKVMKEKGKTEAVEAAKHPLTYIFLWNGNFFGDKLQTRWGVGTQTQAKDQSSQMVMLGQKLNLPTLQWYFDYMGAFDDVDRLGIATSDLSQFRGEGNVRYGKVNYNSFITKVNWQFVPQWNLMLKGMYETASVSKIEELKNYRKSFGYFASLEYYPVKSQDCRLFLSYIGRSYKFTDKSKLADYNTSRIELGFMYRIKAF